MARYTGPVCRLCRRAGEKLLLKGGRCFTPKCAVDKRNKPPGQVQAKRRPKISDHGMHLHEKQKARYIYGMMETQFRNVFEDAEKAPGITGDALKILLERRLDNVVFRLGFADSRAQARQLVRHGHIQLNGKTTNIPSALISLSDVITWREGSKKNAYFKAIVESIESKAIVNWLQLDRQTLSGKVLALPTVNDIDSKFEGTAIVEFYSR